jgi:hypothetical protein
MTSFARRESKGALLVIHCEIPASSFWVRRALPRFLLCIFSAPLYVWRNLYSASGILCSGRYPPGSTGIFWPAEGTSQPVTISKKWKKIPALLYVGKGPEYRPFRDFRPVPLAYRPRSGTDLKSQKGLYSAPSQRQNVQGGGQMYRIWWRGKFIRQWEDEKLCKPWARQPWAEPYLILTRTPSQENLCLRAFSHGNLCLRTVSLMKTYA